MEPKKPFKFNGYTFTVPDNSGTVNPAQFIDLVTEMELQAMTQDRNFPDARHALQEIMQRR